MNAEQKLIRDKRVLALFVRNLKRYRTVWGVPADKAAFRSMWLAAKFEIDGKEEPKRKHQPLRIQRDILSDSWYDTVSITTYPEHP